MNVTFHVDLRTYSWHLCFDEASRVFHSAVASRPHGSLFYFRRASQTTDRRRCTRTTDQIGQGQTVVASCCCGRPLIDAAVARWPPTTTVQVVHLRYATIQSI